MAVTLKADTEDFPSILNLFGLSTPPINGDAAVQPPLAPSDTSGDSSPNSPPNSSPTAGPTKLLRLQQALGAAAPDLSAAPGPSAPPADIAGTAGADAAKIKPTGFRQEHPVLSSILKNALEFVQNAGPGIGARTFGEGFSTAAAQPALREERTANLAATKAKVAEIPIDQRLKVAQTKKAEAEAAKLGEGKEEEWSVIPGIVGPNGQVVQQEKHSGTVRYAPALAGAKPTKTPAETQEQNKREFQSVIAKLDAAGLPTGPKGIDRGLDAGLKSGVITKEEHAAARGYQAANPTPSTNLAVTVAGAQQKQDFQHNEKALGETYKRYETAQDAEQRLSRMEASYQKALKGDQQAMLALLTDHIGMTLGLQKGARITKDILNEATASMPWLEKIQSKFDSRGYLSGVTLGPEQMAQMLDLGYEARDRAVQGAQDSSELYGVQPPPGAARVFGKRKIGEKPALGNTGNTKGQDKAKDPLGVL